jgi:NAD(P)-dependent dehydrogenase (short-subunit alcohol dehydrogenase family)
MNTSTLQAAHHVLITGAARGIGAAIAHTLAQANFQVSLLGRDTDALNALAQRLPGNGRKHVLHADVTDPEAMKQAVASAVRTLGPLHVLVNNAGQAVSKSIDQTDPATWQQMLAVNLSGVYHGIYAAIDALRETASPQDPARIINIASTAGLQGYPHVSAYVAAKHGVIGLTRALALELARQHITVNAVCPGYTETDIVDKAVSDLMQKTGKNAQEVRAMLASRNPQKRMIQPDEVAQTVWWLCQPASASINGQAIALDGGELAG